jgi:hypothetical protein
MEKKEPKFDEHGRFIGTPAEAMKAFGQQPIPQNFRNGRHDRNGIDRSIYSGCCDAARDARAMRGW